MAGKRLAMSKYQEILRLKSLKLTDRKIARALNCSRNTVKRCLATQVSAITPSPPEPPAWVKELNWEELHEEHSKGVPLQVLWEEKCSSGNVPVNYSGFWKQFTKRYPDLPVSMVRIHRPGERAEIDYADGIDILDPVTGEVYSTNLFLGVLCYSRYVFAEFTFTQKSCDFLSSHVRMLEFFGGVPQAVVPDNLKSAVTKAHRYDPELNPAYCRLAQHYEMAVLPAVIYSPKHKAIVERSIQIFQRWFYWRVRKITFTSLVELNKALKEHLELFNRRIHRIFNKTRHEMYLEERSTLKPLPVNPYEVSIHQQATLHTDCHLQFDKNYYSAPWELRGKALDVWATDRALEIYFNGKRVALHCRVAGGQGHFVTDQNHYPPQYKAYLEVTPTSLRKRAEGLGPNVLKVMETLMGGQYPLLYLRRCQGIVGLSKKYSAEKLDQACAQALVFDRCSARFIENLIKNQVDAKEIPKKIIRQTNPHLRGAELYQ